MQERRALIAIVLIFLVYFIFTTVFRPGAKPADAPGDAQPGEAVEAVDSTPVERAAEAEGETGAAEPESAGLAAVVPAVEAPLTETEVTTPLHVPVHQPGW